MVELCGAIARLINENGSIKVERLNEFLKAIAIWIMPTDGGFRWTAGSK